MRFLLPLLAAFFTGPGAMPALAQGDPEPSVRTVLLFVADGAGVEHWTAARLAAGRLAVEEMPVLGLVLTGSTSSEVTDSGAGATALATGARSYNRAVAVSASCQELFLADSLALRGDPSRCAPLETLFDVARRQGKATGIVTTAGVSDATPASFAASSPVRQWRDHIARQLAASDLHVMLGGGRVDFERIDAGGGLNLLDRLCETAACIANEEELRAYRPDDRRLVGLFARRDLPLAGERRPSFPAMVEAALMKLARHPGGFVALFETEGTDVVGHVNAALPEIVAEVLEFDRGVAAGLDFARRNPGTLVVVTADHETGGLALVSGEDGQLVASYSTTGHSAGMVPLFAYGPGSGRFAGIRENDEVGRILIEVVGGSP